VLDFDVVQRQARSLEHSSTGRGRRPACLGDGPDLAGIWFSSLDASSRLAVEVARRTYKLPYFHARMTASRRGE
jgi:hypothetical protein